MQTLNIEKAAQLLARARSGGPLPKLPAEVAPPDLQSGYKIQASVHRSRKAPVAAYKVGMTDTDARRRAGLSEPIFGRLAPSDLLVAPAIVPVDRHHIRIVEVELIFEIGRNLARAKAPFSISDLAAATSALFLGIEICNSRLTEEDSDWPSVVADNSNAHLLVIGDKLDIDVVADLEKDVEFFATLSRGAHADIQGSTRRVCGNPLEAVTWLANRLARDGDMLTRGQLVASGSCTGLTEVEPDEPVVASFGGRGAARMQFTREVTV